MAARISLGTSLMVASCLVLMLAVPGHGIRAEDKPPLPKLPSGKELMDLKMKQAQILLEGLALEDFDKIDAAAGELGRIARAGEFINAHKSAEYQIQMKLFERTVDTIGTRAREKNLDAAMLAYLDMSMSCMKCHKYTRNPKDVNLRELPPDNQIAK